MDKVNHPQHYNRPGRKECIEEMLDIYGPEKVSAFCELNAYKYRYRAGLKGNKDEDLKKADWYLKKMNEISKEDYYMREILFKAKVKIWRDIPKDEWWVEGLPQKMWGEWHIINPNDENTAYPIDPTTICQCTGKTDEDGKKIFEGDIVGFDDIYSTESGYSESSCLGEVVWSAEECCFHVTNRLSAESWEVLDECKVVGNVFDNPELIEEQ